MKHSTYQQRNIGKTNLAEERAEEYLGMRGIEYIRFGFDEKNERIKRNVFFKIPEMLRGAPDFIVIDDESYFLETKGFRGTLKVKVNDLMNYDAWDRVMKLEFFCWDCDNDEPIRFPYAALKSKIFSQPMDQYPDNKKWHYTLSREVLRGIEG